MDKKESATSNSDRDRRQRRLREIKTKGMKKSRSLSTEYPKIFKRENHNCDANIFLVVAILSKLNRVVI